nr:prepilin-type N-terminal cleavage/methylation domain-containing protein [uncultured Roseateles sp.]
MLSQVPSLLGGRVRQAGLSIVEMMVGLAIGLIVVAGASQIVVSQLNENRKLLVELQLQQDLRAAADIITRELRRAGAWNAAETGLWYPGAASAPATNAFREVSPTVTATEVDYLYKRFDGDNGGPYGFKLEEGKIKTRFGDAWQELTDGKSVRVTTFTVTQKSDAPLILPCPKFCSDAPNSTACWPTVTARAYEVSIAAQAVSDASVTRSIRTTVKLRNDLVGANALAAAALACPL